MMISSIVLGGIVAFAPQTAEDDAKARLTEFYHTHAARLAEHAKKNARIQGFILKAPMAYTSLPIPRPITKDELAHMGYTLELSEPQMLRFDVLHEKYLDDGWVFREPNVQPLWDRSAELATSDDRHTVAWGERFNALCEDAIAQSPKLRALDAKLIESMRPYLSDEQLRLLDRVHKLRARQCARNMYHPGYLGGRYDLTETLFQFSRAGHDMTPMDRGRFEEALLRYENEMTSLLEQFAMNREEHSAENTMISQQSQEYSRQIQEGIVTREELLPKFEVLGARHEELRREAHQYDRRLHELNNRTVKLLAEQLPDETGERLIVWWREKIYRYVYPDPYELNHVFQVAEKIETLTDDQRVVIEAARIEYRNQQDVLSQSMLREFTIWNDEVSLKSGYAPGEFQEYARRMGALQKQRHENAEKAIEVVRSALDAEQMMKLQHPLDHYKSNVDDFAKKSKDDPRWGPSWPRPDAGITD